VRVKKLLTYGCGLKSLFLLFESKQLFKIYVFLCGDRRLFCVVFAV